MIEGTLVLLKHAKRISQQQTQTHGKYCTYAYFKSLGNKKHHVNHDSGKIDILTHPNRQDSDILAGRQVTLFFNLIY